MTRHAPAQRHGPAPATVVDRLGRRRGPRFPRALVIAVGGIAALFFILGGVALAYWATSDSSHPAEALAATLATPTAGAQNGTASPSTVPIKWTAPTGYSATGYTVLRCTGSNCANFTAIAAGGCAATITATSCTDSGLQAGTTYNYEVEAQLQNWVSSPGSSFNAATSALTILTFTNQPASGANIPATGTGGFGVSVAIEDAHGNVATGDNTDTVALAIASGHNPGNGTLTCTSGLTVTVSSGVASFTGCDITKVGTGYVLTASSSTNSSLTAPANANSFNITAGTVSQFALGGLAATVTAGTQATGLTLTAEDANGNVVTSFINSKSITWSGPTTSPNGTAPTLPVGTVNFSNGVSTTALNVIFTHAGSQTLTATDGGLTGSATTTVNPGTFSQYGLSGLGATATAGAAVTGLSLAAQDADGNTVTTYNATNQAITWSGPTTSPNNTTPTLPAGTVSFSSGMSTTPLSVTFTHAGSQTLKATDGSSRTGSATITVSGAGPASLALANCFLNVTSQPCTGSWHLGGNGKTLTANVQALDQYGNPATITSSISLTVSSSNMGNFPVTNGSSLTISPGSSLSTGTFTITESGNSGNSGTITVHASGGSPPNLTFTVQT